MRTGSVWSLFGDRQNPKFGAPTAEASYAATPLSDPKPSRPLVEHRLIRSQLRGPAVQLFSRPPLLALELLAPLPTPVMRVGNLRPARPPGPGQFMVLCG